MSAASRALDYMRGQIEVQDAEHDELRAELFNVRRTAAAYITRTYGMEANRQFQAAISGNLAPSADDAPHCVSPTELIAGSVGTPLVDAPGSLLPADIVLPAGMGPGSPSYPGSQAGWQWHNDAGSLDAEEIMATAHARDLQWLKAHPDFLACRFGRIDCFDDGAA